MSWILSAALCAAVFSAVPSLALPEAVGEWHSLGETVLPLVRTDGTGGGVLEDVGRWTQRVYTRTAPPGAVEVNLMEGSGPGPLRVPEATGSGDGLFKAQAEYRILEVAGRRAVVEQYPHLPLALSLPVSGDAVLTLESRAADEEELGRLAEAIIESLKPRAAGGQIR